MSPRWTTMSMFSRPLMIRLCLVNLAGSVRLSLHQVSPTANLGLDPRPNRRRPTKQWLVAPVTLRHINKRWEPRHKARGSPSAIVPTDTNHSSIEEGAQPATGSRHRLHRRDATPLPDATPLHRAQRSSPTHHQRHGLLFLRQAHEWLATSTCPLSLSLCLVHVPDLFIPNASLSPC
jgi:hypothetical protein